MYNKNDWNADPILIYPVKGTLNNWTVDATTTYIWNKHFGANRGLLYQQCKQQFLAEKQPDSPDPLVYYSITDEFKYLKLPINFEYSTNNEAKHQFVFSLGMQTSFLMDYREHFLQKSTGFYSEFELHNKTSKDLDDPNNPDGTYSSFVYNRLLFGINSTMSYRMTFNNGWLFEVGVMGNYDLTNTENRNAKFVTNNKNFWTNGLKRYGTGGSIDDRPKTHNQTLGIFIKTSIPISIR